MKYALPNSRTLELRQEECAESPREWAESSTMVCFHRGYNLGDKHEHEPEDYYSLQKRKDIVILPLYLYDHSGITMNTTGFSCQWDSGQVGFIYMTHAQIRERFGVKRVSQALRTLAKEILVGEVETYDQYLTGDVYYFTIEKVLTCDLGCEHTEDEDSCGGFYGDDILTNGVLDHIGDEDRKYLKAELSK